MQEVNLFLLFIKPLNRLKIPYIITGAAATIIYGVPRLTHDIDLIIQLDSVKIGEFIIQFPSDKFYLPPEEVIKLEIKRPLRGHFNIIHHETGFKADIYIMGEDMLHKWALANKKSFNILEETIWVAPPEYVIIRKLEYFREGGSSKHLNDIKNILEVMKGNIDYEFIREKIKQYSLDEEWEKVYK
jgi:hypothetical protein